MRVSPGVAPPRAGTTLTAGEAQQRVPRSGFWEALAVGWRITSVLQRQEATIQAQLEALDRRNQELDAFTVQFDVPVEAGEESVLIYRIRIEF